MYVNQSCYEPLNFEEIIIKETLSLFSADLSGTRVHAGSFLNKLWLVIEPIPF